MKVERKRQMAITTMKKVKEIKQIVKDKNQKSRKGIDKWLEEIDIVKSDVS